MSDEPSIPKQLDAVASRSPDLRPFVPNHTQGRAKARLHAYLQEHRETVDLATMPADQIAEVCGHQLVLRWLKDPGFASWLFERDSYKYDALALNETAVRVIREVLESDYEPRICVAKDKLKAADMLLTLTGAYPSKVKEIRYLDRDLDNMSDDEVQRQIAEAQKTLAKLPSV